MRRKLTPLILLFFIFKITVAQPWHSYNPLAGFSCNAVDILKPGYILLGSGHEAADSMQFMLQSPDYGNTWHENPHDGLASWNKSIAFADTLNGLGAGYQGRIISTNDGGLNWGHAVFPINRNFNKIVTASTLVYYAAGGMNDSIQTIIKTADGGTSWNIMRDTSGPVLNGVFFTTPLNGFAVGDSGVILSTTNGGTNWSSLTAPVQRNFNAITFINADTGYIAGGLSAPNGTQTLLQTMNGGQVWTVLEDQPGSPLRDISFADVKNGYLVGDSAAYLTTTDGGNTWVQATVPGSSVNERFNAVKFFSPDFGVIGSNNGLVHVYTHHLSQAPVIQNEAAVFASGTLSLTAGVNTYNSPDNISFIYAADSSLTGATVTGQTLFSSHAIAIIGNDISSLMGTPGTYYFTCKVETLDSIYYGDTVAFVVPAHAPQLSTLNCSNIASRSLTLNGTAGNLPVPSDMYFEYLSGYDSSITTVAALPAVVNDTLTYSVLANVSGIVPYTNYRVRVKAVHGNLIMYGNDLQFASTSSITWLSDQPATNVSSDSATFWAHAGNLPFRSQVWFEYSLAGNSTISTVSATPAVISDAGNYTVQATVGNLLPNHLYRYRVKVMDSVQILYGAQDTYFFTGNAQTLVADSANPVSFTTATLHGHVSNIDFPANIYFTFWAAGISGDTFIATPSYISDTLTHTVSADISGLMPYKTYHYNVNASNLPIVLQSNNPATFYTGPGNQTPLVLTIKAATNPDTGSATLNGLVNHLADTAAVFFEYWPRGGSRTLAAAVPGVVNDTLLHQLSVSVLGLSASTLYLYRIKLTGAFGTVYSDSISFFFGVNTIPNFDFENWTVVTGEYPTDWINIFGPAQKVSPGASGSNYAVRLQGGITGLLNALPPIGGNGPVTFARGFPYQARPDTFSGMFDYNIVAGDTAYVLFEFKSAGQVLNQQFMPITGSSGGVFQQLKFPISYNSSATPDTVVLGFFPKNIFANVMPAGSSMTVDNISFGSTFPPVPNGGFENWTTFTFRQLDSWAYMDMNDFGAFSYPDSGCVRQTTDAWHGNYAAEIDNVALAGGGQHVNSYLSTNPNVMNGGQGPSFALNHQPASLSGGYKFFPQDGDSLVVLCSFFKNGIQTGSAQFSTSQPALNYTLFTVPCTYNPGQVADSANIMISILPQSPTGLSRAVVDYLFFDALPFGTEIAVVPDAGSSSISIYPNPANDRFTVEFVSESDDRDYLKIYDLCGKALYETSVNGEPRNIKKEIDLSKIASGIYIVSVQSGSSIITDKLIIQK